MHQTNDIKQKTLRKKHNITIASSKIAKESLQILEEIIPKENLK